MRLHSSHLDVFLLFRRICCLVFKHNSFEMLFCLKKQRRESPVSDISMSWIQCKNSSPKGVEEISIWRISTNQIPLKSLPNVWKYTQIIKNTKIWTIFQYSMRKSTKYPYKIIAHWLVKYNVFAPPLAIWRNKPWKGLFLHFEIELLKCLKCPCHKMRAYVNRIFLNRRL
jgi:hypothetical protein